MTAFSRRRFVQTLGAASAVGASSTFLTTSARAQAKREFRIGLITAAGHAWNRAAIRFGEALQKATDGRLSATVFHSGQLGNESAMMQQMQSGALDMGWIQAAELGSRVSSIAAINAPYLVRTTPDIAKIVRTPEALKLLEVLPRETGTIGLGWGITGMRVVYSAKEINTPQDLKGMKLRINTTPAYRDFYQYFGAAPTPIPTPGIFDAMSNGQVDGLEADMDTSWNGRFDKVAKVVMPMQALFMPFSPLFSARVWQSLDAKDRELIRELINDALQWQINDTLTNEDKLWANLKQQDIIIRDVADFDIQPAIAAFDKLWLPKAPQITALRQAAQKLA